MLTLDGHVKLGGSGAIMNHKEGAGERKRRRRSLTMLEFPASWLAPESSPGSPTSPTENEGWSSRNPGIDRMSHRTPEASVAMDIWALGVACIELSQGRPPRPETPILASFGEKRLRLPPVNHGLISWETAAKNVGWNAGWNYHVKTHDSEDFGMSEEMSQFVARCLTPDPEARPTVHELLKDPFIMHHSTVNQDLLARIQRMVDFVDQCASITAECLPDTSLTLSPRKASHMIDFKLEEEKIGLYLIPMVRPRVDSVYDASSFFDESGLPMTPPVANPADPNSPTSAWKHQRISHPLVQQALKCEQARYVTFRHSRTPSLATILENHLEDQVIWAEEEVVSIEFYDGTVVDHVP
ncbi:p21 protein (Cdc42 Rac)-activated kinase [Mortierella alpina]|nr:p21 protein (Cdc42 Rac)-activated kinase [Mortierella alpina]